MNYVGSVAERFMKFRSTLKTEENISENLFNAISIYVPKSLAKAQLAADSYNEDEVTAEKYAVIPVTVDNYKEVLADGSVLLSQWLPVFNDGTNSSVTLYVIVFDDTDFAATIIAGAVTWEPLTKAFNELYFISFFKTMFSEHYNGKKVVSDPAAATDYNDSAYIDLSLALSYQCELESTLSFCLLELNLEIPEEGMTDQNAVKILSHTRAEEVEHCTTFVGSTAEQRAEYFWGYLLLMGFAHTELKIHNGSFMTPIILSKWFEKTNSTGQFIGNKLAKIRLSGTKVKPTGNPSPLNGDVNLNLPKKMSDILDEKNVGYFISIADNSLNDAEFIRAISGSAFPITAYMISKWVDYTTAQDLAKFATATTTLTKPVFTNQKTYSDIQAMLVSNLQKFAGSGHLENIILNFPPYSEAKKGNTFEGTGVWEATYVSDFEGVNISGSISF